MAHDTHQEIVPVPQEPKTMTVDGRLWKRGLLSDNSGGWYEHAGKFGELIVEDEPEGTFVALWWPPQVFSGEPVYIRGGYKSIRSAMKGAQNYIQKLKGLLNQEP